MKRIWKLLILGMAVMFLLQSCVTVRRPTAITIANIVLSLRNG